MRVLLFLLITTLPALSFAKTPWTKGAKSSYIVNCAEDLVKQGLMRQAASSYCSCAADGMETEFGMEEYKQMMKAEPNPQGTRDDRRLYQLLAVCQKHLRR